MTHPRRLGDFRLQPAEGGWIIEQPERDRIHFLNPSAALLLEFCDGQHSEAELAALLSEAYGATGLPEGMVAEALSQMEASGLIGRENETTEKETL